MKVERRTLAGAEVRAVGEDALGIEGLGARFNSFSQDLGGFIERIAPGAFLDALETSDVRGLFNHDPNFVLGRSGTTMELEETDDGLAYRIPELPKSRLDVLEAIQRGDVNGNSFSFRVAEDGDTWEKREDGIVVRTITKFGELFDVGPVTFPAYPETVVAARSLEMAAELREERADPWRLNIATRYQMLLNQQILYGRFGGS